MKFEEFSIIWLILSGVIGGVISLLLKHISENYISYYLNSWRENKRIIRSYTKPILNDSYDLERRVNNLIRNIDKDWYKESDYYKLTTNYLFFKLFSRLLSLENELSFIEYNNYKLTVEINENIRKLYFCLTSFKLFDVDNINNQLGLKRMTITALGEMNSTTKNSKIRPLTLLEFQNLQTSHDENLQLWTSEFTTFIEDAYLKNTRGAYVRDRLIIFAKSLHELNIFIDTKSLVVRNNNPSNIDLVTNKESIKNYNDNFKNS